jgi:hypothetical protein
MNRFSPNRIAFESLKRVKTIDKNAQRNAALGLAHLLRAHGLSATIGFGLANDSGGEKNVIEAFVGALDMASPIQGQNIQDKARSLQNEPAATYMLHSRLALPLADGFALTARALWPTDEARPQNADEEAAHV